MWKFHHVPPVEGPENELRTLLVVSHDADFLDSVCTDVVHLEDSGRSPVHCRCCIKKQMSGLTRYAWNTEPMDAPFATLDFQFQPKELSVVRRKNWSSTRVATQSLGWREVTQPMWAMFLDFFAIWQILEGWNKQIMLMNCWCKFLSYLIWIYHACHTCDLDFCEEFKRAHAARVREREKEPGSPVSFCPMWYSKMEWFKKIQDITILCDLLLPYLGVMVGDSLVTLKNPKA